MTRLKRPAIRIEVIKQIYNICLLPNNHLILESSNMFMPGFEVYDLSLEPSAAENSIMTVETNASDLTAIRYNRENIFMGFSNGAVNNEIQVYTYNYEKIKTIPIEFNDYLNNMSLLMNDRFIVGSHSQGRLSITNLETESSTVLDSDAIDDSI